MSTLLLQGCIHSQKEGQEGLEKEQLDQAHRRRLSVWNSMDTSSLQSQTKNQPTQMKVKGWDSWTTRWCQIPLTDEWNQKKTDIAVQFLSSQEFLIYTPLGHSISIPQPCPSRLHRHMPHRASLPANMFSRGLYLSVPYCEAMKKSLVHSTLCIIQ